MKTNLLTWFLSLALVLPVGATFVTFENVTGSPQNGFIPQHYGGFGWNYFYPGTDASGNGVAVGYGLAGMSSSGLSTFNFYGADLAWKYPGTNGILEIHAFGNGVNYNQTFLLTTQSTWITLDFIGINSVVFGTPDEFAGRAVQFVAFTMDNMNVGWGTPIPEPATYLAGALLLAPLGVSAFRKLHRG